MLSFWARSHLGFRPRANARLGYSPLGHHVTPSMDDQPYPRPRHQCGTLPRSLLWGYCFYPVRSRQKLTGTCARRVVAAALLRSASPGLVIVSLSRASYIPRRGSAKSFARRRRHASVIRKGIRPAPATLLRGPCWSLPETCVATSLPCALAWAPPSTRPAAPTPRSGSSWQLLPGVPLEPTAFS